MRQPDNLPAFCRVHRNGRPLIRHERACSEPQLRTPSSARTAHGCRHAHLAAQSGRWCTRRKASQRRRTERTAQPVGSAHDFDRTVLVAERKSDAATLRCQRRVPVRAVLLCRSTDAALIALFGADRVALQPGREDVDGRRGVRMSLPGSILARMTRFNGQDLSDSEFRECDLTRARLIGVVVQDAVIDGLVTNLMVNGVEVSSYVEAELDRRHPVRLLIRSADPADLVQGFRELRAGWTATLSRLLEMPEGCEHERVGGEWSAVETLRHLVFVHDSWFRRCCLGSTKPFTAIGLASAFVPDQEEQGLDPAATPSLDEVLAVRDVQGAELRRWLSTVTPEELSALTPVG